MLGENIKSHAEFITW